MSIGDVVAPVEGCRVSAELLVDNVGERRHRSDAVMVDRLERVLLDMTRI